MTKRWEKYSEYLTDGDWHVHTNYTDGRNTILEYCKQALENGLKLIAFTEHVRRTLNYSFDDLLSEVDSARNRFTDLVILAGCEAKVLDVKGNIDASMEVLEKCDIVLGVFHSTEFKDKNEYLTALRNMLRNKQVDVWGHPTWYARKHGLRLTENEIKSIIDECIKNRVLVEFNLKYNLPDTEFKADVRKTRCTFVYGSDAHSIADLRKIKR